MIGDFINIYRPPINLIWLLKFDIFFPQLNHHFSCLTKFRIPSGEHLPVRGVGGVVDGQLWRGARGPGKVIQAAGAHVGEEQPVAHVEFGQEAALHHKVQLIQRGTPQAAGVRRCVGARRLLQGKAPSQAFLWGKATRPARVKIWSSKNSFGSKPPTILQYLGITADKYSMLQMCTPPSVNLKTRSWTPTRFQDDSFNLWSEPCALTGRRWRSPGAWHQTGHKRPRSCSTGTPRPRRCHLITHTRGLKMWNNNNNNTTGHRSGIWALVMYSDYSTATCGYFAAMWFIGLTWNQAIPAAGHHLLGDHVDGQGEGRRHIEGARLGQHAHTRQRREVGFQQRAEDRFHLRTQQRIQNIHFDDGKNVTHLLCEHAGFWFL